MDALPPDPFLTRHGWIGVALLTVIAFLLWRSLILQSVADFRRCCGDL